MTPTHQNFTLPEDWKWGFLTGKYGGKLRYGYGAPEGDVRAMVIIAQGFGEFGEKYGEVVRDLYDRQMEVWIMDWHGQGGSSRFLKKHPQRVHSRGFANHVGDLKKFIEGAAKRRPETPVILMGHSMGGHLALRYLHDHPEIVDAAVLTAPMMGIYTGGLPVFLVRFMARFATLFGFGKAYVLGGEDWRDDRPTFAERHHLLSQCPVRGNFQRNFLRDHKKLRTGSATFAWLFQALRSLKDLKEADYLLKIRTPIQMFIPEDDKIVVPQASERAAALLPHCMCVPLPTSKHEPWMETDPVRDVLLQEFDKFIDRTLTK